MCRIMSVLVPQKYILWAVLFTSASFCLQAVISSSDDVELTGQNTEVRFDLYSYVSSDVSKFSLSLTNDIFQATISSTAGASQNI